MVVALRKTVDTEAELAALSTNQNGFSHFSDIKCVQGSLPENTLAGRAECS
jgi:hypothetical protein